MKKQIAYSTNESDILGLKVGRLITDEVIGTAIRQEILEDAYDVVRLRTAAANENVVRDLSKLGFPSYFSGSIRKYKTKISDLPEGKFFYPDLVYEAYDGSQNDLLYNLLKGTWGDYPLGYYKTPYLNTLVDKEVELKAVFEFYKRQNLPANNPNNGIMFMKHNGNYVGFFALNTIDDHFESHIGGIIEPYRTSHYFVDMQEYIRRFCIKNELNHFCFGARNENGRVQTIFQKFGYTPFATDNIFHITPFLSLKNSSTRTSSLTLSSEINEIRTQIIEQSEKNISEKWVCNMIKTNNLDKVFNQSINIEITTIKGDDQQSLSTCKIKSNDGDLLSWGYLEGTHLL